jgi:hypothetical protein
VGSNGRFDIEEEISELVENLGLEEMLVSVVNEFRDQWRVAVDVASGVGGDGRRQSK